jgi:hypothetical protein
MLDFNKYRQLSPFYSPTTEVAKTRGQITLEQAIMEFNLYQQYAPNTREVYVNGSNTPISGTMVDVTDLEARSDTKWIFTSLDNKIYVGDYVKLDNEIFLCIYNKRKNIDAFYKAKIQPCKTPLNLAVLDNNIPSVKSFPIIMTVYTTDIQEGSKRIPVDSDLLGVSVQYNEFTIQIKKQSRIYLFDDAFEIVGVDYTNIDFENGSNKGYLRWMIKASILSQDADNFDLKVCDYYKIFSKPTSTYIPTQPQIDGNITYSFSKGYLKSYDNIQLNITTNPLNEPVIFSIEGNNLGCLISNISNNSCIINSNSGIGILKIKITFKNNPSVYTYAKIQVKGEF